MWSLPALHCCAPLKAAAVTAREEPSEGSLCVSLADLGQYCEDGEEARGPRELSHGTTEWPVEHSLL